MYIAQAWNSGYLDCTQATSISNGHYFDSLAIVGNDESKHQYLEEKVWEFVNAPNHFQNFLTNIHLSDQRSGFVQPNFQFYSNKL